MDASRIISDMMLEQMTAMNSTRQDLRLTSIVVMTAFVIVFLVVRAVENNSIMLNIQRYPNCLVLL